MEKELEQLGKDQVEIGKVGGGGGGEITLAGA